MCWQWPTRHFLPADSCSRGWFWPHMIQEVKTPAKLHVSCDHLPCLPLSHAANSHHTQQTALQSCLSTHHKLSNPAPSSAHPNLSEIWSSETALSPARQASAAPPKVPTTLLPPHYQPVVAPILAATILVAVWIPVPSYWKTSMALPIDMLHRSGSTWVGTPFATEGSSAWGEVLPFSPRILPALEPIVPSQNMMPTRSRSNKQIFQWDACCLRFASHLITWYVLLRSKYLCGNSYAMETSTTSRRFFGTFTFTRLKRIPGPDWHRRIGCKGSMLQAGMASWRWTSICSSKSSESLKALSGLFPQGEQHNTTNSCKLPSCWEINEDSRLQFENRKMDPPNLSNLQRLNISVSVNLSNFDTTFRSWQIIQWSRDLARRHLQGRGSLLGPTSTSFCTFGKRLGQDIWLIQPGGGLQRWPW